MSEPTIYNEIALKIKGQQKEVEKLRKENYKLKKELKLAEENEEHWHNAFSDLEDEYARLKDRIEKAKSFISLITNNKMFEIRSDNGEIDSLLNILNGKGDTNVKD